MESASQRWGRENLFDWPSKVSLVVGKTSHVTLTYVFEALYVIRWRTNQKDPCSTTELKRVVPEILWTQAYIKLLLQEVFTPAPI